MLRRMVSWLGVKTGFAVGANNYSPALGPEDLLPVRPAGAPAFEPLEPRLLLNADLSTLQYLLTLDVPSLEQEIHVGPEQRDTGGEADTSCLLTIDLAPAAQTDQPVLTSTPSRMPAAEVESAVVTETSQSASSGVLPDESAGPTVAVQQDSISASEASPIEIRGPPNLPGLQLVDPDISNWQGQIIYLDFDGAQEIVYDGPVTVGPFNVPAFRGPGGLTGQEQRIIPDILARLEETFSGSGIGFTTRKADLGSEYSTIHIGGSGAPFGLYGSFFGLAQQVDVGNLDAGDKGFVFSERFAGTSADGYVSSLAGVVAHEVGHLLGYEHSSQERMNLIAANRYGVYSDMLDVADSDGRIDLDYRPNGVTVSPDGQYLAVTHYDAASKVTIVRLADEHRTVVDVGSYPAFAVFSSDSSRVFVSTFHGRTVAVIEAGTGSVLRTISGMFSYGGPYALDMHPSGNFLYVTDGGDDGGKVVRIDTDDYDTTNIPVGSGAGSSPYGITSSPLGDRAYVSLYNDRSIAVIQTATSTVPRTISMTAFGGGRPYDLAVTPDGSRLYVTDIDTQKVWIIDTHTYGKVGEVSIGAQVPWFLTMSPDGGRMYVSSYWPGSLSPRVSIIDTGTNQVIQEIPVNPRETDTSADGRTLYVANYDASQISIVQLDEPSQDVGSLLVTVKKQDGSVTPNAIVKRYDSNWNLLDSPPTNSTGQVSWSGIATGDYHLEAYYNTEFWTGDLATVSANLTTNKTLQRNEPYAYDFKAKRNGTDVTGGTVDVGTLLEYEINVTNRCVAGRSVRVTLWVDRSRSSPYDYGPAVSQSSVIAAGGTGTFTFSDTVNEPGTHYRSLQVDTWINNGWVKTDGWAWDPAITAVVPTGSLQATAYWHVGKDGQQQMPVSGAEVLLYQENASGGWDECDSLATNVNGQTPIWADLPVGGYNLRLYYHGEYWAQLWDQQNGAVQVASGVLATPILQRNEPFGLDFRVMQGATDISGGTIPAGTSLQYEVEVTNKTAAGRNVRVTLWVDRSQSSPYDYSNTPGPTESWFIAAGATRTLTFSDTVSEVGTHHRSLHIETQIGSAWVKTDGWSWSPIVTAYPTGSLQATAYWQAGDDGQPPIPVDGADVVLYQKNASGGWDERDRRLTDASGKTPIWSGLPVGGYNLRLYYHGEYWAQLWDQQNGAVQVASGAPAMPILQRDEPYGYDFRVMRSGTDITGGTVGVGDAVQYEIDVTNRTTVDRSVRVTLWVDADQASPYDYDPPPSGSLVVGAGVTRTFTFSDSVNEPGTHYRSFQVETWVEDEWEKTDWWDWGIAVTLPPIDLKIKDVFWSGYWHSAAVGDEITVSANVMNKGSDDLTDPYTVTWLLTTQDLSFRVLVGSHTYQDGIPSNEVRVQRETFVVPHGSSDHRLHLYAVALTEADSDLADNCHLSDEVAWFWHIQEDSYESDQGNNTFASAADLGRLRGARTLSDLTIHDDEDVDIFRFSTNGMGQTDDCVTLECDDDRGDLMLKLYDGDMTLLSTSDLNGDYEEISFAGRRAGTYYIEVSGRNHDVGPEYDVEIKTPLFANWTFMFYLGGDSNLEEEMEVTLDLLATPGSRDGVDVIALIDKNPSYHGSDKDTEAVYVDQAGQYTRIPLTQINPNWQTELRLDDPTTLSDFVAYATTNYPAENYLLDLLGHGNGWYGMCPDYTSAEEEVDRPYLTLADLRTALSDIKRHQNGDKIDVLALDACVMASVEVLTNLVDCADIVVASQLLTYAETAAYPWIPWAESLGFITDWQDAIQFVQNEESVTSEELAEHIIDRLQLRAGTADFSKKSHSWIAVDLDVFGRTVVPALRSLAGVLVDVCNSDREAIQLVRECCNSYDGPLPDQADRTIDVREFATNVIARDISDPLTAAANGLSLALDEATIKSFTRQGTEARQVDVAHLHGMGIHFPRTASEYPAFSYPLGEQYAYVTESTFAINTEWDDVLSRYLQSPTANDDTFPVCANSSDNTLDLMRNDYDALSRSLSLCLDYSSLPGGWGGSTQVLTSGTIKHIAPPDEPERVGWVYTPRQDYVGEDSFRYVLTACEGEGSSEWSGSSWANVTITVLPGISIDDVEIPEGANGAHTASFGVTLSAASDEIVTVDYVTTNGSAAAGEDYQWQSGRLVFSPRETTKTIGVQVYGDTDWERDEWMYVNLSNASNAIITSFQGRGEIQNDDSVPPEIEVRQSATLITRNSLAFDFGRLTEDAGGQELIFTVSNLGDLDLSVGSVVLEDNDGFQVTEQPDGIVPGGGSTTFQIRLLDDQAGPKSADVCFSNSDADENPFNFSVEGFVVPLVRIADAPISEGDSGSKALWFEVTLSSPSTETVRVHHHTADNLDTTLAKRATAGSDYEAVGGVLTFNPDQTIRYISVTIYGDTEYEMDQTFWVVLDTPENAVISRSPGVGTIQDDDYDAGEDYDDDGLSSAEEAGPQGSDPYYDGNDDTTPDCLQSNVTSFHAASDDYITVAGETSTEVRDISVTQNPSPQSLPAEIEAPYGFIQFEVEGVAAGEESTVDIVLPNGSMVNSYYKYGPTPDNPTSHWDEFLYDGHTGAEILGNVIRLHFIDGSRGDGDLTVNGSLSDPGGPVYIDRTPPVVSIERLVTNDPAPCLQGMVDDESATVQVMVAGNTYAATNNGDGTWILADNAVAPVLTVGVYDVIVTAIDLAGNVGTDATTDELTIAPGAVDQAVSVSLGLMSYDRRTLQTKIQMTITNTSETPIVGPVWVVIKAISNSSVQFAGGSGTTSDGYLYLNVTSLLGDGRLAPGERITTWLSFSNPLRRAFNFSYTIRGLLSPPLGE